MAYSGVAECDRQLKEAFADEVIRELNKKPKPKPTRTLTPAQKQRIAECGALDPSDPKYDCGDATSLKNPKLVEPGTEPVD